MGRKTQFLIVAKRNERVIETLRVTAPSAEMAIKRACVLRPIEGCALEAKEVSWKRIAGRTVPLHRT